jgi:anti-sigma factor RsiW
MHLEEPLISEYVDEALDSAARAEVDRHLDTCEPCRRLVEDLREIRHIAASLDLREPPVRAWSQIERAIRLEAEHRSSMSVSPRAPGRGVRWTWLATAAVLVLAAFIGLRYGGRPSITPAIGVSTATPPPVTGSSEAAQSVEADLREAETHYERAFRGLEQIATAEKGTLDPATAAALQKNFAVIDQAINESRAAVRAQPTSEPARDSLMENFKTKLGLLQDTVALINEMRKGNEAGTARIVSGLKQKGD